MKKTLITLLALAVSFSAFAQPKDMGKNFERMQAERAAYITQELELTSAEAEKFWPVFNAAQKENWDNFKATGEKKSALREAIDQKKSDSEIKAALDEWLKADADRKDAFIGHRADFEKAIGTAKTARFYLAQEGFRDKTIRNLASGRHRDHMGRGDAQRNGPGQGQPRQCPQNDN